MCSAELASEPVHKSSCSQSSQLSQVNHSQIKLSPVLWDRDWWKKNKRIKSCFICWKLFSSSYHSIFTSILHFTSVLNHCLPSVCLTSVIPDPRWIKFLYLPFCGCCLTHCTKLNTRSGCPPYNLATNSKDFPESLAKLLGMIFLYFGTPLTC